MSSTRHLFVKLDITPEHPLVGQLKDGVIKLSCLEQHLRGVECKTAPEIVEHDNGTRSIHLKEAQAVSQNILSFN